MVKTDYTTVGGWLTDVLENLPEEGETAETGVFRLTASKVTEQTVEKVIVEILRTDGKDDESDE